jgi:hypothetical protein
MSLLEPNTIKLDIPDSSPNNNNNTVQLTSTLSSNTKSLNISSLKDIGYFGLDNNFLNMNKLYISGGILAIILLAILLILAYQMMTFISIFDSLIKSKIAQQDYYAYDGNQDEINNIFKLGNNFISHYDIAMFIGFIFLFLGVVLHNLPFSTLSEPKIFKVGIGNGITFQSNNPNYIVLLYFLIFIIISGIFYSVMLILADKRQDVYIAHTNIQQMIWGYKGSDSKDVSKNVDSIIDLELFTKLLENKVASSNKKDVFLLLEEYMYTTNTTLADINNKTGGYYGQIGIEGTSIRDRRLKILITYVIFLYYLDNTNGYNIVNPANFTKNDDLSGKASFYLNSKKNTNHYAIPSIYDVEKNRFFKIIVGNKEYLRRLKAKFLTITLSDDTTKIFSTDTDGIIYKYGMTPDELSKFKSDYQRFRELLKENFEIIHKNNSKVINKVRAIISLISIIFLIFILTQIVLTFLNKENTLINLFTDKSNFLFMSFVISLIIFAIFIITL